MKKIIRNLAPLALVLSGTAVAGGHGNHEGQGGHGQPPAGWFWGVGVNYSQEVYQDFDQRVIPMPLIGYRDEKWQVFGPFVKYKLLKKGDFSLSASLAPRFDGYDDSDSDIFKGMDERKWSIDGGLGLSWSKYGFEVGIDNKFDLLDRSGGYESELTFSKKFRVAGMMVEPGVSLAYQSEDLVDYYYGVKANEANATRAEYKAGSAVNSALNLSLMKPALGGMVMVKLSSTWYDDAITDSPLVDEDAAFSALLTYSRPF